MGLIRERPLDHARLLFFKAALVLNNRELGNNHLVGIEMELTPVPRLAFLPFGLIMAFAVAGLFAAMNRPSSAVCATFLGAFLMRLLFYVCTRFRMTLAPAAVVLAGGGLDRAWQGVREGKPPRAPLAAAGALCLLSLAHFLPLGDRELLRGDAEYWANLAVAFEKGARYDRALWACERALAMSPETLKTHHLKTGLLKRSGVEGERLLSRAGRVAARFPGDPSAHVALADILFGMGRDVEAMEGYRRAIASSSDPIEARRLMERWRRMGAAKGLLKNGTARDEESRAVTPPSGAERREILFREARPPLWSSPSPKKTRVDGKEE